MAKDEQGRYIPQWADDEIQALRRKLATARERIDALEASVAGNGDGPWSFGSELQGTQVTLPADVHSVRAALTGGFELYLSIGNKGGGSIGREGFLEVMVTSHHGMQVLPQAANVVHIGPGRI